MRASRGVVALAPRMSSSVPATKETSQTPPVGKSMSSADIRKAFLTFFEERGHARKPSASLIPDDPTILLTIAGMVPFKPIFLGIEQTPDPPRATSSQKCIRTNDIENVGVTKRHHTFFEMLGNFSFGDYFKQQAILWSWELLTKVYEIPEERLAVSVFEEDDEAYAIWRDVVGVNEARIRRMGAEDNFWASGPTGPCGPCSEIYFDFDPLSTKAVDLEDDDRFIELYNLVFMQFSRGSDGTLTPLESQNIDTGMGLERMAQVLQQVPNNYETDLIRPIMNAVGAIAGVSYDEASPKEKTSLKVAGDHIRAVAHLMADGVRSSNIGRGYIVRRLLRRVVRHGRLLGIDGPFVCDVLPVVSQLANEAGLTGVEEKLSEISTEIAREEARFLETLERGEARLDEVISSLSTSSDDKVVSGADAFELYDTYGFPLELTEEIASEAGLAVDKDGFAACMEEQRQRARAARGSDAMDVEAAAALVDMSSAAGDTSFNGYDRMASSARVTGIMLENGDAGVETAASGDRVRILLDETPFYAEGGGQVGDAGMLKIGSTGEVRIDDTRREAGVYLHVGSVTQGTVTVGDTVTAEIDAVSRRKIQAHHTATHLLQAALKEVIPDGGISQAGSLVDADRLRFDFNCPRAVSASELQEVEALINQWIEHGHNTVVDVMPIETARERGAVAMFGEKYGSEVRVVDVPGVSMELCGGTHVASTNEIGLFKIMSESGPSSGVRRIEAVCGSAVMPYLSVRDDVVKSLCVSMKARPEELPGRVSALQDELKAKSRELDLAMSEIATSRAMSLIDKAVPGANGRYIASTLPGPMSADSLKTAAERLGQKLGDDGAVLLACPNDGKVAFVSVVGKTLHGGGTLNAGKLVGAVAKVCGGGGGGRPNIAQAGGRDASKLNDAMSKAEELLRQALGSE